MRRLRAVGFLFVVALAALPACRRQQLTGINLTVQYDAHLNLSTLLISGMVEGTVAFMSGTLPEPARVLSSSGHETAVILLPATFGGKTVTVRIDGRAGKDVVQSAQQAVVIEAGRLVDVMITLGERAICGDRVIRAPIEGCDDGNTASGDGCSATCQIEAPGACDVTSCSEGCCAGGFCRTLARETCGPPGAACVACEPVLADNCSPAGTCRCGVGAACDPGQRCLAGACVCDGTSCPSGCCSGGACVAGDSPTGCGTGGLACQSCLTGGCSMGVCTACSPSTCPNGCCSGSTCYPRSVSTCGTGGMACVGCDPDKVDTCSVNGVCQCGGRAACAAGQHCMNGLCVCDLSSCASGCCAGDICRDLPSLANCGMRGSACLACDATRADRCGVNGLCRCGAGLACAGGQRCAGGQCICDATSCPSGCCQGAVCATRSLSACGDAGSTCVQCDARSDNCSASGTCRCGVSPACAFGQRCLGSTCVCDGTSCRDGCCAAGMCLPGDSDNSCGVGGNTCETCPASQTCTAGRCSGCNYATCPGGCCSGATCNAPSLSACGQGGAVCTGCDNTKADGCSAMGVCVCGAGAVCGFGQKCAAGKCVCDVTSCPTGCCDGTTCVTRSVSRCGLGGSACAPCDAIIADSCTDSGSCACGAGAACAAGQHCVGGSCMCDPLSCAHGCCMGSICRTLSLTECGAPGAACAGCGITADRCSPGGACLCGATAPCGDGQHCVAGACVCDAMSCASGCCAGSACLAGTSDSSCGSGGAACQDCAGRICSGGACGDCTAISCANGCCSGSTCTTGSASACGSGGAACVTCDPSRADNCSLMGECRCGANPACGSGTSCVGSACVCGPLSCPNGCCSGSSCLLPSPATCGTHGGACAACDSATADGCDPITGGCRCGTDPACGKGTACVGGTCHCDELTCPNGCCAGAVCSSPSVATCGKNGGTCVACDVTNADTCSLAGTCQCGSGPSCPSGLRCNRGTCVCDSSSCPTGCCGPGDVCHTGTSDLACGTGGAACQECAAPATCQAAHQCL